MDNSAFTRHRLYVHTRKISLRSSDGVVSVRRREAGCSSSDRRIAQLPRRRRRCRIYRCSAASHHLRQRPTPVLARHDTAANAPAIHAVVNNRTSIYRTLSARYYCLLLHNCMRKLPSEEARNGRSRPSTRVFQGQMQQQSN